MMKNFKMISKKLLLLGIITIIAVIAAFGSTAFAEGETNTIVLENFDRFDVGDEVKGYQIINPEHATVVSTNDFSRAMHMAAGKMGGIENGERVADRLTGDVGFSITLKGDPSEPINLNIGLKAGYYKKKIIEIIDGRLILSGGKIASSVSNTKATTLTFTASTETGRVAYYIDGKLIAKQWVVDWIGKWWDGWFLAKPGKGELTIDGFRMYYGDKCETQLYDNNFTNYTSSLNVDQAPNDFAYFHTSDINAGGYKRAQATDKIMEAGTTLVAEIEDFHDSFKGDKYVFTKEEGTGQNEACYRLDVYRMGSRDFPIWADYPYYVTRGKFTADDTAGMLLSRVDYSPKFGDKVEFEAAYLMPGGYVETSTGIKSEPLNFKDENGEDVYHEIAIYHNMAEVTYDVVLDGKVLALDQPMPEELRDIEGFATGINNGYGTAKIWKWTNIGLTKQPERITDENGNVTTIKVTHHSQFPDDDEIIEYLQPRIAFHGEVKRGYWGGAKHDFTGAQVWDKDTKELYLNLADLSAALGTEVVYNGNNSWSADGKTFIAGEPRMDGETVLAPVGAIGKQLGWYTKGYEYGDMVILSPDNDLPREGNIDAEPWRYVSWAYSYEEYTGIPWNNYPLYILTNAQMIADYIQYWRPSAEELLADYQATTGTDSTHPKIMLTQDRVEVLKKYLADESDTDFQNIWRGIMDKAEQGMKDNWEAIRLYEEAARDKSHPSYKDTSGRGRNYLQRNAALGIVYRVTGDEKYGQKLKERTMYVSGFTEYNIQKSIDPGFWMAGVALGLDWAWELYTPEERSQVLQGIIYAGLEPTDRILDALNAGAHVSSEWNETATNGPIGLMFQYDSYYPKWAANYYPYNMGGVSLACALAMDENPEFASQLMAKIIRGWEYCFKVIYPHGAWTESPSYGDVVGQGFSWGIGALDKIFGSTYDLEKAPGMENFIIANVHQSSWQGSFGWADCSNYNGQQFGHVGAFAGFAAKLYDRPDFMAWRLFRLQKHPNNAEFIDCIYYEPLSSVDPYENLQTLYHEGGTELVAFHEDWTDPNASVFFMAGGAPYHYHRHDDTGDFMLINRGICWTYEIGTGNYNVGGTTYNKVLGRTEGHSVLTINPDNDPGYTGGIGTWNYTYTNTDKLSMANHIKYEVDENGGGGYTILDMTDAHDIHDISRSWRGARISDNYKTFTIRDELTFEKEGDGWWFMQTDAALEQIDDKTIIMSKNGKNMVVSYDCTANEHHIEVGKCELLPSSPVVAGDPTNAGNVNRIGIYFKGGKQVDITVRISEFEGEIDTTPMAQWTCPKYLPEAEKLNFDFRVLVDGAPTADTTKVQVFQTTMPKVEVVSDNPDIEIQFTPPTKFGEKVPVILKSKTVNASFSSSLVVEKSPLTEKYGDTLNIFPIADSWVSSEAEAHNPGPNMRDQDLETRWYGANKGDYCVIDLGKATEVNGVFVAQWKAHERDYYFDIYTSSDGENFEFANSFTTQGHEDYTIYRIAPKTVRYLKIVGQGNNVNAVGINLREFWAINVPMTEEEAAAE